MKYAVRYYTKTGNTKKLALEVASTLGVDAMTTNTPLAEMTDVLFLGSSVYAAGVADEIISFIRENRDKIGMIVNFSTAALMPSTYNQVKRLAVENGIQMCEKEFHCRGSFMVMHRNHPDVSDLANVKKFTKEIMEG